MDFAEKYAFYRGADYFGEEVKDVFERYEREYNMVC